MIDQQQDEDVYLSALAEPLHDHGEYHALCRALLRSALSDLWCLQLGTLHEQYGLGPKQIRNLRRAPATPEEKTNQRLAIAWMNGDPSSADEPLRWVDVCVALGIDSAVTRRLIMRDVIHASPRRRATLRRRTSWQAVPA